MTVEEVYSGITANGIEAKIENAEGSNVQYWEKVADFWKDIKGRDAERISIKQREWLSRIEEDIDGR